METDDRGILLFRRDFRGLTGGHLKVWHYLRHAAASPSYRPLVYQPATSRRGAGNPFDADPSRSVEDWQPEAAAALFVAGLDWQAVPAGLDVPVVNLVQGVRHADPADPRRAFLSRRAVRICVSPEVAAAILGTGLVNGPVVTIPNGVDVPPTTSITTSRPVPLLLVGWKEPERTREVASALRERGVRPEVIDSRLPRERFLARLGEAETVVFLPLEREGCFLPALEAFALGCLVVCPDCVGNRGFCRDGDTCLAPDNRIDAIVAATLAAVDLPAERRGRILAAARDEVTGRALDAERGAFLALLDELAAGRIP